MNNDKQVEKKRGLRLVERYDNDDYSRFAAPDYEEHPFEIGLEEENVPKTNRHVWDSGVRGGSKKDTRSEFYGKGPKGYKRTDEKIYEDVCEMLMRHRDIDASEIAVSVKEGVVTLSGRVDTSRNRHLAELIIEDLSGVREISNELSLMTHDDPKQGPEGVKRKDLGIT